MDRRRNWKVAVAGSRATVREEDSRVIGCYNVVGRVAVYCGTCLSEGDAEQWLAGADVALRQIPMPASLARMPLASFGDAWPQTPPGPSEYKERV